jgi:hypothetical protein
MTGSLIVSACMGFLLSSWSRRRPAQRVRRAELLRDGRALDLLFFVSINRLLLWGPVELWATRQRRPSAAANPQGFWARARIAELVLRAIADCHTTERTEGSSQLGAKLRAATLYSVGSARDPDHEAADALRQRSSETADPFSVRHAGHALTRAPPPRIGLIGLAILCDYVGAGGQPASTPNSL